MPCRSHSVEEGVLEHGGEWLEDDTSEEYHRPECGGDKPDCEVNRYPEAEPQDSGCPQENAVGDEADNRCCCQCTVHIQSVFDVQLFYFYVDSGAVK